MRRPHVIAILCATLLAVGAVALWLVPKLPGWTPFWAGWGDPEPASPPGIPSAEMPQSGGLTIQSPEALLTAEQVASAWVTVTEAAERENWVPWVVVADATTGNVIFERDGNKAHTPASLMKILTAYATLSALDPQERLETGVSQDGANLYLWGEGDLMLSGTEGSVSKVNGRAGLSDLAAQVAENVEGSDQTLTLYYQDELFVGPARASEHFEQGVTTWVGEVGPYAIDTGRVVPGEYGFYAESAKQVAEVFRDRLVEAGITVGSVESFNLPVPAGAVVVGMVESATVLEQVQVMLEESDNTLAEQYCRLAASRTLERPVTLSEATSTILVLLERGGIDTSGLAIKDCSGLNKDSRVKPQTIIDTMAASLNEGSNTTSLTRILAVGGLSGTLDSRFTDDLGYANVAGKTGSLGHVSALAILGTTASGEHLYIAVGADDVPDDAAWWVTPTLDAFVVEVLGH